MLRSSVRMLEESAGRTAVGIAKVLTEEQARPIAAATGA